jgi:hypothetical protein
MTSVELFQIQSSLEALADGGGVYQDTLQKLGAAAESVGEAFSGSWLGYHSRVYYSDFQPPPPGAHFSQAWGLQDAFDMGSTGDWYEYPADAVKKHIHRIAGQVNLESAEAWAKTAEESFDLLKAEALSIFQAELAAAPDSFLEQISAKLQTFKPVSTSDIIKAWRKNGQVMSHDMTAVGQGFQVPPHFSVFARVLGIERTINVCGASARELQKAASHISRRERSRRMQRKIGTNVFIGHGGSFVWRDLKDFIQDRMRLPYDEFNRVPVAGLTNIARLSEMLDSAAIAFIVMTAEDEQADGKMQARMNVVHEAGLFQGSSVSPKRFCF